MINLLPYLQKKKIKQVQHWRVAAVLLIATIVLAVIALLLLVPSYLMVQSRFKIAQASYGELEKAGRVTSNKEVVQLSQEVGILKRAFTTKEDFSVLTAIERVNAIKPSGISITRISMEAAKDRKISFSGIFKNRAALQQFSEVLASAPSVASVDNPVSNFIKNENGEFNLLVQFKEQ